MVNNLSRLTCYCTLIGVFLVASFSNGRAQSSYPDTGIYNVALILPFEIASTQNRLDEFLGAHDVYTANRIHLSEEAQASLDFYEGLIIALQQDTVGPHIKLSVYDCWSSDSVTKAILAKPELKKMDIVIGAMSTANSKLVADFCRMNRIINIQPFSPSKSLTTNNPYHIKLAPTIDSHIDNMFLSIVDSFPGANVIIYTPNIDKDVSAAERFDSLFRAYNLTAEKKFTWVLLNTKDMKVNGIKTTAADQLKPGVKNIWIITSFEESFVNGNMRVLYGDRVKYNIVAYGMPTWLNGDVLRLDYINDFETRLTDPFFVDSFKVSTRTFMELYNNNFNHMPEKNAYMGYDVTGFMLNAIKDNGRDILSNIATTRFRGTAYTFDIAKNLNKPANSALPTINFFENRYVNVFRISDYQLRRVF